MNKISDNDFLSLVEAKSVEEFLVKDIHLLRGKFNESDSRELVTTFIVNHRDDLAEELFNLGEFEVGDSFVHDNEFESISRQSYINIGMKKFIQKHYEG